jgi:hypothetical protein
MPRNEYDSLFCNPSQPKNDEIHTSRPGLPEFSNLGRFWRALQWKMVVYFLPIMNFLRPFWYILRGNLALIWSILFYLGILCQEKSGNHGPDPST